jgi:hypothetical protein
MWRTYETQYLIFFAVMQRLQRVHCHPSPQNPRVQWNKYTITLLEHCTILEFCGPHHQSWPGRRTTPIELGWKKEQWPKGIRYDEPGSPNGTNPHTVLPTGWTDDRANDAGESELGHADASRAKKIIADEFHGRFQPKDTRFLRQAKGPAAWNSFQQQNKGLSRVEMLRWTVVSDASDASHADAPECSSQRLRAQSAQSPPEAVEESEGVATPKGDAPVLASPRPSGHHRCCSTTTAASWGPLPATHAVRAGLQEPRPRGRTDTVLRLESWSLISIFFEGLKALPKINVVNHLFFFKNLSLETRCFQT